MPKLKFLVLLIIIVGAVVIILSHPFLSFGKRSVKVINSVHVFANNHYHDRNEKTNNVLTHDEDSHSQDNEVIDPNKNIDPTTKSFREHKDDSSVKNIKEDKIGKETKEKVENNNIGKDKTDKKAGEKSNNDKEKQTETKVDNNNNSNKVAGVGKNPTDIQRAVLTLCSARGENLVGPLFVDQSIPSMTEIEKTMSVDYGGHVEVGGWWAPSTCKPRAKVAIVIPYRNRFEQLMIYLRHIHPFLQRQQLFYRIIVVEQMGDDPFNRAGLFNIGYAEALKLADFDCFIFSDVDLLPEDDRNYYGCPTSPRHMSVAVDKFNYQLPYQTIFGGVGAFKKKHFEQINGMSNLFWGWGGEDDDLYQRVVNVGLSQTRPSMQIGRYTMIKIHHFQSSKADPNRMNLLQTSKTRMIADGLNTLKYNLQKLVLNPLVTIVQIEMKRSMYMT